jgi:carboxypeptidase C (cathepsin A)
MKKTLLLAACATLLAGAALAEEAPGKTGSYSLKLDATSAGPARELFTAESAGSDGSVTIEGQRIDYHAVAGTLVVHPKGWDDASVVIHADKDDKDVVDPANPKAEASMFYVAYFKKGAPTAGRPITFIYNG